jgi:hypothetical protein
MVALNMKTYLKAVTIGTLGTAAWLLVSAGNTQAQEPPTRGNFNPQQMRQRMIERLRDQFDVKDDSEWKAIAKRIEKVMEARRNLGGLMGMRPPGFPEGRGMMGGGGAPGGPGGPGGPDGFRGPGGPGGPPPQGGEGGPDDLGPAGAGPGGQGQAQGGSQGRGQFRNRPGGPGPMGGFNRQANPEMEALRKAIEDKAPTSEIKAKLAAVRAARDKKEAELEKAQDELRAVLSTRQEAIAVTLGLLK